MNKFVFLITCFNEEVGIIKTLKTIYSQSYENWRIIIRNDMSTDNTINSIENFISSHKEISHKITLIDNKRKYGEVENTLDTLKKIDNDEKTNNVESIVSEAVLLPDSLEKSCQIVLSKSIDILLYLDSGMSAKTYLMSLSRLALVQALANGHISTSGVPNIDYYISSNKSLTNYW